MFQGPQRKVTSYYIIFLFIETSDNFEILKKNIEFVLCPIHLYLDVQYSICRIFLYSPCLLLSLTGYCPVSLGTHYLCMMMKCLVQCAQKNYKQIMDSLVQCAQKNYKQLMECLVQCAQKNNKQMMECLVQCAQKNYKQMMECLVQCAQKTTNR